MRLLIVGLVFVLLLGCGGSGTEGYRNEKYGFSIRFPEGWEVKEGFMGTAVLCRSPKESSTDEFSENINIVVEQLSGVKSLNEYYQKSLAGAKTLMDEFRLIESKDVKLSGRNAKRIIYSAKMGGDEMKYLLYLIKEGDRGFAITCSALADTFSHYLDKFEESIRTFRID